MTLIEERRSAIHLLRVGQSVDEVADELGRSTRWVRKWRKRYETDGWDGLKDQSRCPHKIARQTSVETQQTIRKTRSELEAEASAGRRLKYIGGQAIRTRLKEKGTQPLPSIPTIERVIHAAGMTRPYQHKVNISWPYIARDPTVVSTNKRQKLCISLQPACHWIWPQPQRNDHSMLAKFISYARF